MSCRSIRNQAFDLVAIECIVASSIRTCDCRDTACRGGGPLSALITGSDASGIDLRWPEDPNSRQPLGSLLTTLPGGVGLLGLGVVPVAATALLIGWKRRLVWFLIFGSMAFLIVSLTVRYAPSPYDLFRLDGHARNFALLALLLAVAIRIGTLRERWRYAAGILILGLVAWPSSATPVRTLALEVGHGIELANARIRAR